MSNHFQEFESQIQEEKSEIKKLNAEIARLKEENGALLFTYHQLEKEWYEQRNLIGELAYTLTNYYINAPGVPDLLQRARLSVIAADPEIKA